MLLVGKICGLMIRILNSALRDDIFWHLNDQVVRNCGPRRRQLVHRQVKTDEVGLNQTLLHHDLVEVGQHVVNTRQVWHVHFESERFGNIYNWAVNVIGPAQVGTLISLVTASQGAQDRLLGPLVSLTSVTINSLTAFRAI